MFARLVAVASFGLLVVAAPGGSSDSQCNTGSMQCCQSTETANSEAASALLGVLGIVLQDPNALLGFDCSPIDVIGLGGGNCNASPVCCEDNSSGNLVSVGCVPVTL